MYVGGASGCVRGYIFLACVGTYSILWVCPLFVLGIFRVCLLCFHIRMLSTLKTCAANALLYRLGMGYVGILLGNSAFRTGRGLGLIAPPSSTFKGVEKGGDERE